MRSVCRFVRRDGSPGERNFGQILRDQCTRGQYRNGRAPGAAIQTADWNNINVGGAPNTDPIGNGGSQSLYDNHGTAVASPSSGLGIVLHLGYTQSNAFEGSTANAGFTAEDLHLFTGDLATGYNNPPSLPDNPASDSIVLTNVPYASYNLYVYFYSTSTNKSSYITDSATGSTLYVTKPTNVADYEEASSSGTSSSPTPANYAVFAETSSSDTVTFNVDDASNEFAASWSPDRANARASIAGTIVAGWARALLARRRR